SSGARRGRRTAPRWPRSLPRGEDLGQRGALRRPRLAPEEPLGRRERGEELGLGDEELRQEVATRTHTDEPGEKLGAVREQLDEPSARAGGRQEALELVERLVGVGALPEGVEEHRVEALERRAELA